MHARELRIRYTNEPLGDLKVVPDFFPDPKDLVFREEGVKVTIALSKRSVEFFKSEARKHHTQYQCMIPGYSTLMRNTILDTKSAFNPDICKIAARGPLMAPTKETVSIHR